MEEKDRGRRAEGSGQLEARPPIMLGGSLEEMVRCAEAWQARLNGQMLVRQ